MRAFKQTFKKGLLLGSHTFQRVEGSLKKSHKRSGQKAALLTGTGGGVIEVSAVVGRSKD